MKTEYNLTINPELQAHLPQVSEISDTELEQQLVAAGRPDDPIRTWNGCIIDGHRRYALCEKHGLPYETVEMEFDSIDDVKAWMDSWQGARRNLSDVELSRLTTRLLASKKRETKFGEGEVAAKVAEGLGVNKRTIYRNKVFTEALDSLPKEIREDIASNKLSIAQADVIALAEFSAEDQKNIHESVKSGEFKSFRDAIHGEDVAPEPEPAPSPSGRKPFGAVQNEIQKTLAKLGRLYDEIKYADPISHKSSVGYIDDLSQLAENWRKPAVAA